MNTDDLKHGNLYLYSKSNESIYIQYSWSQWTLHSGVEFHFNILKYYKPKYPKNISMFGTLKLPLFEVEKYLIDLDTVINSVDDIYDC